jgi:hypothetical protein
MLFYKLGRMVGPHVRKVRWIWQSMTGSEDEAIRGSPGYEFQLIKTDDYSG